MCSCYRKTEKWFRFCTETLCVLCVVQNSLLLALRMVTAVLIFILWSTWSSACLFLLYSLYTARAVPYTLHVYERTFVGVLCTAMPEYSVRCVYILFEYLNMRAPMFAWVNVLNVVVYNKYGCLCVCYVDFGQVRLSKPNALMPINSDSENDCTRTHERANERASELPNERMNKRAREKWRMTTTTNELCSDERVNNPLNCVRTQTCVRSHTHTHSFWDMPILNSDFVTGTNMTNASE